MASLRSAQSVDIAIHVLVRARIADSFHFVEHGPIQLAGRTRGSLGGGAAHVDAARTAKPIAIWPEAVAGHAPRIVFPPPPKAMKETSGTRERNHGDAQLRKKI
jgi:hypothetical protein